jgi:single-stranded-DNA-specific exonuclease
LSSEMNLELAQNLTDKVWGQGFPQPTFSALFNVDNQRIVGEKHLKLKLRKIESNDSQEAGVLYDAILFFHNDPLPDKIEAVYQLQVNEYNNNKTLQLLIDHWLESDNEKRM